jgi:hypothetical protein
MKTILASFVLLLFIAAGCSTAQPAAPKNSPQTKPAFGPETMLVTYRVRPGSEMEFEQVLAQAWTIYRKERLVHAWPHVIVRDKDGLGGTSFVEIFSWVDHEAPDHPPKPVQDIWARMTSLCEARNGHPGIEGAEVEVVQSSQ